MKKLIFGTIFLALITLAPAAAIAGVDIRVSIPLPPLIVFPLPPAVIAVPDTDDVYAAPDIDIDLFFWSGWWWRPWEGRWYRSQYYDRDWVYYNAVPGFYFDADSGWRGHLRSNYWRGHRWDYERIPYERLRQNWKHWQNDRYWGSKRSWDVRNYQPRPQQQRKTLRHQRQQQYELGHQAPVAPAPISRWQKYQPRPENQKQGAQFQQRPRQLVMEHRPYVQQHQQQPQIKQRHRQLSREQQGMQHNDRR